ncbi:L,D-transpeptidase [Streptomyces triculaminicus]|uniref:L,D-transpeptidase n=1 Tax=Streptomyces triculaminicus TaxID=2816232 RepID=A0A939FQF2_9ACTN|nr:L,D-transpeptidase [Streptomyces triculaminicus]MBO0654085.1 L,D-transpeptidase [Streptomyces triculaminicus]
MSLTSPTRTAAVVRGGALGAALAAAALLAAPTGRAAAAPEPTRLQFTKYSPTDSRLSVLRNGRTVVVYRAGSGVNDKECERGRGWLPNGTYPLGRHHTAYGGNLIKGYAIELGNKLCYQGINRTELFIHSEMTRSGGQGGPEGQRWDGVGDYSSHGCVKLSPQDIKSLFLTLDRIGWPTTLRVVNG